MIIRIEPIDQNEVRLNIYATSDSNPESYAGSVRAIRTALLQALADLHALDVADASIQYAAHMLRRGGNTHEVE